MSHVLAYAARAQIRSHSSPFSLLSYRLFDITRIHNAHCLYTRNFPLFHVFSLLLFSSPSCFCFLQFPFFPSCVLSPPLYLSVELTFFCLLASHSSLRLVNLVSFFFFFTPPKRPSPFPYSPSLAAISPPFVPTFLFFIYSSHVPPPCPSPFVSIPFRRFQPVFPPPRSTNASRACIREDPKCARERSSQRACGCWPRARCTFCRERSPLLVPL